jgi:tetratricopeptide (TPR) repeat protein
MRCPACWQVSVLLLLGGMAAGAQVQQSSRLQPSDNSSKTNAESLAAGEMPAAPSILKPGVTVTGKPLYAGPPLPKLPPDEFANCIHMLGTGSNEASWQVPQLWQLNQCELKLNWEKNLVLRDCVDLNGKTPPRRIIQACTESLDHDVLPEYEHSFLLANRAQAYLALGDRQRALEDYAAAVKSAALLPANERFVVFASRADAYFALGDRQRALEDYDAAIQSAPRNALLYYDRGVLFSAQADYDAALRDFDTALKSDSKFVPALRQRAKIYAARGNLTGALRDYSEAIRLQPKSAALWSDRGELDLGQREYAKAIADEAQAIQLDPKLASAYYLRSVAFGNSGDRAEAVRDLRAAVGLDPSLAAYVKIDGKTVILGLPPL